MTTKRIICKIKLFYGSLLDETCILKLAFFYNYHQIRNELKLIIKLINLEYPYWFTMFCCIIISLISYLLYAQLCFSYILNCPQPHSQNEVYPKLLKKKVFMKHWSQIIGIFSDTCTDNLNLIKILENINKYAHFIKNKSLS